MSVTTISTSHDVTAEQFNNEAFKQYVSRLVLAKYMGTGSEAMVHIAEDLNKGPGDAVTMSLMSALTGAGVTGESAMEGSEEAMTAYGHRIVLQQYKNAARLAGSLSARRPGFDIKAEMRPALVSWLAQKVETLAFTKLGDCDGVAYASATEAQKDAWLVSNTDRVLYGAAVANQTLTGGTVTCDSSASLLNVDATADICQPSQITLAKRMAQLASPKIRPIKLEGGEEVYVMFVHPYCARDIKGSSDWKDAQKYAMERGQGNPIFTGALGMYDSVIVVESEKIPLISGVGASSINVAQNFLCGAQALVMAHGAYDGGSKVVITEKLFDYDDSPGVQIKSTFALEKALFNSKQNGVVTVWSAAVAD